MVSLQEWMRFLIRPKILEITAPRYAILKKQLLPIVSTIRIAYKMLS